MQKDSFYNAKGALLFLANNRRGVSKVKMARRRLSVGGYSFPAIPTQSTVNEGLVRVCKTLSSTPRRGQKPIAQGTRPG